MLQNEGISPVTAMIEMLSWTHLWDSYRNYLLHSTAAAICLAAYVIISFFLIIFLLQPKAARTWSRQQATPPQQDGVKAPAQSADIADLHCSPIRSYDYSQETHGTADAGIAPDSKHMPSMPSKTDMAMLHQISSIHSSAAILYVTDSDSSEHLLDSLGAAGLAVISSRPGREAAHHVAITKFDAIVIDIMIAEASRLCTTRLLEALPAKPRVPVLILANTPGQTLNIAATNACIDYLYRPFDDGFLVAKVHSMLNEHDNARGASNAAENSSAPYDKQMEQLVDSLPAVVDDIQLKSEQKSLASIELQSDVIATIGEDAAGHVPFAVNDKEKGLPEEVRQTAEKVDEMLRLCATIKPPKKQT
ncbi:MAG TPA: hypothetical protein VLH60_07870 [Sedimentisphaerales bacterium]|nr:hypothetical protein [Sedimentisphaerales bacterium]